MLVVDASFAVRSSIRPGAMERLRGLDAIAPELLWSEATSALHQLLWRGEITVELAAAAIEALTQAPIAPRGHRRLRQEAWAVAERLGWAKTYDAEYVALARLHRCPLLTTDARMARGAAAEIEMLSPMDL